MDHKLGRDEFYSELYHLHGHDLVKEAGYFPDTSPTDESLVEVTIPVTPTGHLRREMNDRPAVILMTGSLCPVHQGHLAAMDAAKQAAEAAGFQVIGGYLSPGHDEYISSKVGDRGIPASCRISMAAKATAGTWISVDPWEALHRSCAVNFTDVIVRLRHYLRHHLGRDIEVIFVCGGDNARFALTFARRGHCVVVSRPGSQEAVQKYRSHPLLQHNSRVMWADGDNQASSSAIRGGNWNHLPENVEGLMTMLPPKSVTLRVEGIEMLASTWDGLRRRVHLFQEEFESLLSKNFHGRVRRVHVESQVRMMADRVGGRPIISLDPMLPASHNLAISREFDAGGYQQLGYVPRPGSASFAEQVSNIPDGSFYLFDDDIVTGGTVRAASDVIGHSKIAGAIHLETSGGGLHEVLDCRDFLLGAREGGLVVRLPSGTLARVPYVFPMVDPTVRASIRPEFAKSFSRHVLSLNIDFYQGTPIRVADLPHAAQAGLTYCGFSSEDSVVDVCHRLRDSIV